MSHSRLRRPPFEPAVLALGLALAVAPWTASCSKSRTADGGPTSEGGGGTGPCPAAVPPDGSACTDDGLVCAFGDDPRSSCRPRATCTGGTWSVAPSTCPPLSTMCPATRDAAAGAACTDEGAVCGYDRLACVCTNCTTGGPVAMCSGPTTWHCDAPNADPSCPAAIPNLGTPCTMEGQECIYGCETGLGRKCVGGVWTETSSPGGCPVSTRRAKRDIHYLSADEVTSFAHTVRTTRLATYAYRDPALRGRRHLGFIIEDQPDSYSVDPERNQVDLYGYTSMLVAAVQAQDRRIDRLEHEVRRLRKKLDHRAP